MEDKGTKEPLLLGEGEEWWREAFSPFDRYEGLSEEEAFSLLDLSEDTPPSMLERGLVSLAQPMPIFLLVVALLCFAIRDWVTGLVVVALTSLHVAMTLHEEVQMTGSLEMLKSFLTAPATVKRSGQWTNVSSRNVVRGDLVLLKMGQVVPADAVLQGGEPLELDQSMVTGESFPVVRDLGQIVLSGSVVLTGGATAVVLTPAKRSLFGRSAQLVSASKSRTPLQFLLLKVAGVVSAIALVMAILLMIIKVGLGHSAPLFVLQTALGMLVAAVPISMAVVVTSAFAITSRDLSEMGVLVSRFASIEQLAGMEISLLDKTGTLSQNRLEMAEPWLMEGVSSQELCEVAALTAAAEMPDAIDKAILSTVKIEEVMMRYHVVSREGFTPVRKHSSATVIRAAAAAVGQRSEQHLIEMKKGAAKALLEICNDPVLDSVVLAKEADFARRGLRALAVAKKETGSEKWTFLGLLTFRDALRPDAADLISGLKYLGVEPKMLTGDGQEIARETCRMVGLGTERILSRETLINKLATGADDLCHADAFSQVYPEDKFNVVAVLQRNNTVVGMTGDGINDCPAMRQADIGIAVHGATPACMVAADMIMMTEQLSSLQEAILMCRLSIERLRTYLLFRINCTFVILFWSFFGAVTIKFGFPALAFVCIAWTNNLAIFAIVCDNSLVPLRPTAWRGIDIVPISIVFCVLSCLQLFSLYYLAVGGFFLFTPGLSVDQIRSVMFLEIVLLMQWSVLVVRSRGLILGVHSSRPGWLLMLFLALSSFSCTLLVAFWPFGNGLAPVAWNDVAQVWIIGAIGLLVTDIFKVAFDYILGLLFSSPESRQTSYTHAGAEDEFLDPTKDEDDYKEGLNGLSRGVSGTAIDEEDDGSWRSHLSMMDRMFDVLFLVMFSHLGLQIFRDRNGWSYADFFGHWIPIYMTWVLLEGFANRFVRQVRWIPFLYLLVSFTLGGLGLNFYGCHMNKFQTLSECSGYATFLAMSRFIVAVAWCMAGIVHQRGRWFFYWKVVCALVPALAYWGATILTQDTGVAVMLPTIWFVGIGLDIFLNFVSSSFVWLDRDAPRLVRYTEERFGMLLVIALAEVVISTVLPRASAGAFWYESGDRYSDVVLVLIIVFVLAMYKFALGENLDQISAHALCRQWWRKCIWMICQFVGVTAAVVIGLIAKLLSSGKMASFDRISFGLSAAVVIFSTVVAQWMNLSSLAEQQRRITSKAFRLIVRSIGAGFIVVFSLLPVWVLSDTNWLVLCVVFALICVIVEGVGRVRVKKIKTKEV